MVDRFRCYGKDDFGHPYDALSEADEDGDWVRFEDYQRIVDGARNLMDRAEQQIRVLLTMLNDADFKETKGADDGL